MSRHRIHVVTLLVLGGLALGAAALGRRSPAMDMSEAARRFLATLSPELRAKAAVPFDDKARTDWHFIPRARSGVRFSDLNDDQRAAARDLVRSALSSRGALKVEQIIALESILQIVDKGTPDEALRDPGAYTVTVYGEPVAGGDGRGEGRWAWKLEGHHISLNFTVPAAEHVRATPSFLGASPARVRQGPSAGLRVMAVEEDLARELARSLDETQRKECVMAGEVPREVVTRPGVGLEAAPVIGLAYSGMNAGQQSILVRLIEEFAHNLRYDLATAEMDRIRGAGLEHIRFAWAGEFEPGRPHYYRISGPTFIIEYDNTQNNANHIHTVWHDRERDFGRDILKEHYEHGHPHK